MLALPKAAEGWARCPCLAEGALRLGFQAFALPLGLNGYHLPDMDDVADVAKDYYSNDLRGGEGHMEVGKLIINVVKQKAHITVSVKPFGCMPSSGVSDGVQSLITSKFPGSIFCAVETSGDGATNFYSRVQMYMFKARIAADEELQRTYKELGLTEPQVRDFLAKNPRFASPLHKPPHVIAGTAADLLHEVAPYLTQTRAQRAAKRARSVAGAVMGVVKAAPVAAASQRLLRLRSLGAPTAKDADKTRARHLQDAGKTSAIILHSSSRIPTTFLQYSCTMPA